jgi:site-specific DNA-methyltransferase (adenine-specific)
MGPYDCCSVVCGDCLEVMKDIPPASVDMVLCDLPYGITSNPWDSEIPLDRLWPLYSNACKGRIALFAAQPFTSFLVCSNIRAFKHAWTWVKTNPTGFQNAKRLPLRITEDVLIFQEGRYNPQGLLRIDKVCKNGKNVGGGNVCGDIALSRGKGRLRTPGTVYTQEFTNYPWNVLECGTDTEKVHPTQKPTVLVEYLIKTYTNAGDLVLDNCIGSGTTAVAATNLGRHFLGMELEPRYVEIARQRIEQAEEALTQQLLKDYS